MRWPGLDAARACEHSRFLLSSAVWLDEEDFLAFLHATDDLRVVDIGHPDLYRPPLRALTGADVHHLGIAFALEDGGDRHRDDVLCLGDGDGHIHRHAAAQPWVWLFDERLHIEALHGVFDRGDRG